MARNVKSVAYEYRVNGKKLDSILESRKMSYADIAKAMGRSPKYLSNKVHQSGGGGGV